MKAAKPIKRPHGTNDRYDQGCRCDKCWDSCRSRGIGPRPEPRKR